MKGVNFFLIGLTTSFLLAGLVNSSQARLEDFFYRQFYLEPTTFLAQVPIKETVNRILPEEAEIQAKSVLVLKISEDGNQEIIFEKDSQMRLPIASLTKLMTALISLENQKLSKAIETAGGEKLEVRELLKMALESSNDAAQALAEALGSENFLALMNSRAAAIGLRSTKFSTPTGLEAENNFSTARDLANLVLTILREQPVIFEISRQPEIAIFASDGRVDHRAVNTNELLRSLDLSGDLKIIGGKTGFTEEAGGCLVLVLRDREGNTYIDVLLGTAGNGARFLEARKLIEFFN